MNLSDLIRPSGAAVVMVVLPSPGGQLADFSRILFNTLEVGYCHDTSYTCPVWWNIACMHGRRAPGVGGA